MQKPLLERFQKERLLKEVSTFEIGGPARLFVEVFSTQELQEALLYCQSENLPFFILGKGSNSLFHDRGFNGLVIANKIGFCNWEGDKVHVGAGYSFSLLGTQSARKHLAGLEFASGIPGTVGGAIYMNAGANGSEVCETVEEVEYVTGKGEIEILKREEIFFAYRTSSFQKREGAIASARFSLRPCDLARDKQLKIIDYRTRTQPYCDPSAGCVFRNPTGFSAGALIEQSGLKGTRVGGAEVSLIHANFIVNRGDATAQDVEQLAALIKEKVKEKTGIDLEMEVRTVPYV
ncbi:MAG: UDP-N-acetylenolpyruvoylglucosamine reductase [Chlamydiota bacterium]|jgi:UDP-N-acetylmuramate dehydrogenase